MTDIIAENPAPETAPELVERVKRPTRPDDSCKAAIDELQATSAFFLRIRRSLSLRHPVGPARLEGDLSDDFCASLSG